MEAAGEIARNFPHCVEWSEESFTGRLHEWRTWDAGEYLKLESAVYELAQVYHGVRDLPREICWRVLRIFSSSMVSISVHYDRNDGYRIRNLTDEHLSEWRERLQLVIEGFFEGEMPKTDILVGD